MDNLQLIETDESDNKTDVKIVVTGSTIIKLFRFYNDHLHNLGQATLAPNIIKFMDINEDASSMIVYTEANKLYVCRETNDWIPEEQPGHTKIIRTLKFVKNIFFDFVVITEDNTLSFWVMNKIHPHNEIENFLTNVKKIIYSGDKHLVFLLESGDLHTFNILSGIKDKLNTEGNQILNASFNPNKFYELVVVYTNFTIAIIDVRSQEITYKLENVFNNLTAVIFNADNTLIAFNEANVTTIDIQTSERRPLLHNRVVSSVSSFEKTVVVAAEESLVVYNELVFFREFLTNMTLIKAVEVFPYEPRKKAKKRKIESSETNQSKKARIGGGCQDCETTREKLRHVIEEWKRIRDSMDAFIN